MEVTEVDEGKVLHALYEGIYRVGFGLAWPYTHGVTQRNHARLNAVETTKPRDTSEVLKLGVPMKPRFAVIDGGLTPGEAA